MKKIGVFFGLERQFAYDLIDRINDIGGGEYLAEPALIGGVCATCDIDYDLALDRISIEAPFYLPIFRIASVNGKKVINNPFRIASIDNLSNYAIAKRLKLNIPKSALLPNKHLPYGATGETFRNLMYPLDWDAIFEHVGFPAYIKPLDVPGWLKVYKVYNQHEFFSAYDLTGSSTVYLQESIEFDYLARVFIIGDQTRTLPYYPFRPLYSRFQRDDFFIATEKDIAGFEKTAKKICDAIGYDCNTVDFGVKDGKVYVLDFLNPAPTFEPNAMSDEDYQWALNSTAKLLFDTLENKYKMKDPSAIIYNDEKPAPKKTTAKKTSAKKPKD